LKYSIQLVSPVIGLLLCEIVLTPRPSRKYVKVCLCYLAICAHITANKQPYILQCCTVQAMHAPHVCSYKEITVHTLVVAGLLAKRIGHMELHVCHTYVVQLLA